jgi:hypothetical protein
MHGLLHLPLDAHDLARIWAEAAFDPRVDQEIRAVHAECADEVRERQPICVASGKCCRFQEYGHRLYVTGLETAWALRELGATPSLERVTAAVERGDCPFLDGTQCGAHAARPLGCRTYYCDPLAQIWQQDLSEQLLGRVKRLHDKCDVPYRYGDWRTMLAHFA